MLVFVDSPPGVWLVLILGVSAPRMTISNRMYYLNSVMHSRLYNNRGAGCPRLFMCKWTPGLPRIFTEVRSLFHVPNSSLWPVLRAGHISRMRYACPPRVQRPQTGKDHIVLKSLCKFVRIGKILPAQCNNDEKPCYSSADINCGQTT